MEERLTSEGCRTTLSARHLRFESETSTKGHVQRLEQLSR